MAESTDTETILNWLANGGQFRMTREMKTNAGDVFRVGEQVRLVKLEPSYVEPSYIATVESLQREGKIIRIREIDFRRAGSDGVLSPSPGLTRYD